METLTLGDATTHAANTATVQVQVQLEQQSPTLEQQHHHQQQHQLVSLSDMAELTQGMQEDIVAIPKEIILITLVSQEPALYNPKHEYYRNTQRKDVKWVEIAENVGWSETQCKSKWKAMRDQYCRELKRSKFNIKANVKWKYFKELEFLRPFALSRNYRPRTINAANKNNSSMGNINNHKFPSIKIETGQFTTCEFTSNGGVVDAQKNESTTTRLLTALTDEQLNSVMQQQSGSWNYLTTTNSGGSTNVRVLQSDHHNGGGGDLSDDNLLQPSQHQPQQSGTDEMLCALVESVAAAAAAGQMQQHQNTQQQQQQQQAQLSQQQQQHNTEEEDDDPIHTFLNMESFFEKDLISTIQQYDILYNSCHPSYRNAKLKLDVWDEIARKLKKPVRRCRLKWKALRDQYIREHKRLKDRENAEQLPRWKHYDALCFLQKFIKHKTNSTDCYGEFDGKNVIQIPKIEIDADLDDHMMDSSPLRSEPVEVTVVAHEMRVRGQTLPSLSGPHTQHQLHATTHDQHNLCVVAGNSVSGYDEMDIDHYIIGNASDNGANDDGDVVDAEEDEDDDEDDDHKSQQHFPDYTPNTTNNTTANDLSSQPDNETELEADDEFKDVKAAVSTQQDIMVLQQQQQTSTPTQQQQHQLLSHEPQQQQHLLAIEVTDAHGATTLTTTDESLIQHHHHHQQQQHQQQQQQQQHDFDNDIQHQQQQQQQTHTHNHVILSGGSVNGNNNGITGGNCGLTIVNNGSALSNLDSLHLSALVSGVTSAPTTTATTTTTTAVASGVAAASSHGVGVTTTVTAGTPTSAEDDEVGAFFKAVAMKIRNAKMSPVAFTDLQIDILRVINGTLRNH